MAERPSDIICIGGPTAAGKSSQGIALAKRLDGEIISVDSRQVYKELNIGTAKTMPSEYEGIPHHLISIVSIHDPFTVQDFVKRAKSVISGIMARNKRAILVGGTGFYFDALLFGLDDMPEIDPEIRAKWNTLFELKGLVYLQDYVKKNDPNYFEKMDTRNPRRLIRAAEIIEATGRPFSDFHKGNRLPKYNHKKYYLHMEREKLYTRINERVDQMVENGLFREATNLYPFRHLQSLQTVGYQEIHDYIAGIQSSNRTIEEIKKNSRRYAKRQLTWFKNHKWKVISYPYDALDQIN